MTEEGVKFLNKMNRNTAIKIIAIGCLTSLTISVLLAWNSPATSYESSIYSGTPIATWICLGVSFVGSIGIIVYQASKQNMNDGWWLLGLILLVLGSIVVLALYAIRGYPASNIAGDFGNHLMQIKTTTFSGHVAKQNHYPLLHIHMAQLTQTTGAGLLVLSKWMAILLSLANMVFLYLLARVVLVDKAMALLAAVAGIAVFPGSTFISPNFLANALFPLALYLLLRGSTSNIYQWRCLLALLVFFMGCCHPVPAFALCLILFTLIVQRWVVHHTARVHSPAATLVAAAPIAMLSLVWTIVWASSFFVWESVLQNLYEAIAGGAPSEIQQLSYQLSIAKNLGYNIVEAFFKFYAALVVYLVLALLALLKLHATRYVDQPWRSRTTGMTGPFIVMVAATGALCLGSVPFGPLRLLRYALIFSSLFIGFGFFQFMGRASAQRNCLARTAASFLTAVVLLTGLFSAVSLEYSSPYSYAMSGHPTRPYLRGSDWFLHNSDTAIPISGIGYTPGTLSDALLSPEERATIGRGSTYVSKEFAAPYHFAYDVYPRLGESYERDVYLVLTQRDRLYYVDCFPEIAHLRFSPSDFAELECDPTVDRLYANGGELDAYFIHSSA